MTKNRQSESCSIPSFPSVYSTWNWSLQVIEKQNWVKDIFYTTRNTRYPIKLLRYWFMYNLIRDEQIRLGRPLRVCEIGVDRGQMLRFTRDAGFSDIASWVAVDYNLQPELKASGYSEQIQANVEDPDFFLDDQYDVIIVLHLLEHLFEPEQFSKRLSASLAPGGILIGGFPVKPNWAISHCQKKIRRRAAKFGHVSVFSPKRVKEMADHCGLCLDFISGAFLFRKSGSFLENFKAWMRTNVLFGGLFPALGGEIYWRMRK